MVDRPTGTGRFAADIEDIRALLRKPQRVRCCGIDRRMFAAVGEGIRSDIDDAHDARAIENQYPSSAIELGREIEHLDSRQ